MKISSSTLSYNHAIIYAPPKIEELEKTEESIRSISKIWEIKNGKYFNQNGQCSCVTFIQQHGYPEMTGYGYAKNFPINSQIPKINSIIITSESWTGHVGLVKQIWHNTIVIEEYNFVQCKITLRELTKDSPVIKGYYERR